MLSLHTPNDVALKLGSRLREARLRRGWKQATLGDHAGVSAQTVHRFEATGRTTTLNLLKMFQAVGRLEDFDVLLQPPPAATMNELVAQAERPARRRRGRR